MSDTVRIEYEGESADAVRAAQEVEKSLDAVEKKAGGIGGAFSKLGGIISGALSTAGGLLIDKGLEAASDFIKDAIGEAQQNAQVQAELAQALANTSNQTGVSADMANDLASALQLSTKFTDDQILAAETVLARFKEISADIFPDTTEAALDLATVLKIDSVSAAKLLGKALAEPGEGLARLKAAGIVFSDAQEKVIKDLFDTGHAAEAQKLILDELARSIGGTAEAMGKTPEGQAEIFSHMVDDIKQSVGDILLPFLNQAMATAIEIFKNPEVQAGIENFVNGVAAGAQAVAGIFDSLSVGEGLSGAMGVLQGFVDWVQGSLGPAITGFIELPAVQKFGGWFNENVLPPLRDLAGLLGAEILNQFGILGSTITESIKTLGIFATWLDTEGIPALQDFGGAVNNDVNKVVEIFSGLWLGIVDAFENAVGFIENTRVGMVDLADAINGAVGGAFQWFKDTLLDPLLQTFNGLVGAAQDFYDLLQWIAGLLPDITVPDWMQRHSPSPLEQMLTNSNNSLREMASLLPSSLGSLAGLQSPLPFGMASATTTGMSGGSTARNFYNNGTIIVQSNNPDEMLDQLEQKLGTGVNIRRRNRE